MRLTEKYYPIDKNTAETIRQKIAVLAKSYTPEWVFSERDPDIGSTIALIFANMMDDSAHKTNMLLYKYHIELMNMMGITLKPAVPARSVVHFSLLNSAPTEVFVKKHTQLLAYPDDNDDKLVFETEDGICLTKSKIADIYATSNQLGKIIKLFSTDKAVIEDETQELPTQEGSDKLSFNMFDFSGPGEQKNLFLFGNHSILTNCAGAQIYLKFEDVSIDGRPAEDFLFDGSGYRLGYITGGDDFSPFKDLERCEDGSLWVKDISGTEFAEEKTEVTLCLAGKEKGAQQELAISKISMRSGAKPTTADVVYAGDAEQEVGAFAPFTETLSEYKECFIGSSAVLSKKGALAKVCFELGYEEKEQGLQPEEEIEYKHVMKKPKVQKNEVLQVTAQKVALEYFNGSGWRKLTTNRELTRVFDGTQEGELEFEFVVPQDIEITTVNAFETYWLRLSVVQADNAFRMPAVHKYPVIKNLKIGYEYRQGLSPDFASSVSGVEEADLSKEFAAGQGAAVFSRFYEGRDCVFMGFDAPMESGPISIYLDIVTDVIDPDENHIGFEYSCAGTGGRFKELRVVDKTEKLRHSGCIVFNPPKDFSKTTLFNKSRYWIKIVNIGGAAWGSINPIKINDIKINAVEVKNIETMEEEAFYVDRMDENITFELSHQNILDAKVFVNEAPGLTLLEKEELLRSMGKDVIAQTDIMGNYVNFFVKWQEVDSFMKSGPEDRHYILDRQKGKITFGDAKHGKIPQSQPRVAVRVFANTCAGELGNVEVGAISRPSAYIKFLEDMGNIIPAYAGYDSEDMEDALRRGAELMGNRGSLVSRADFVGAVKHFSSAIDKVRCEVGVNASSEPEEGRVTIAVLMKEFYKSSEVFVSLKDEIKENLLKRCDANVRAEDLELIEPNFFNLNVNVWVTIDDMSQAFEIQNAIKTSLAEFLHPVRGNFNKQGWAIGNLPQKDQIYSFLKTLDLDCSVNKIMLTSSNEEAHPCELDYEKGEIPMFSVVVSGEHRVYVDVANKQIKR